PILLKFKILFSNDVLLKKYQKEIPKTWDDLIETAKDILKGENDENLIGYNGYFPHNDDGIGSFFEFIYSFRDSRESGLPELTSKNAINAMDKLKYLKNQISSNEIFQSDKDDNIMALNSGKIIFSNYWNIINVDGYSKSALPGGKKGISGSFIESLNIGICNHVSKEKIDAAIKFHMYSPLQSIYRDDSICSVLDCNLAHEIQPIQHPENIMEMYNNFLTKFPSIFSDFLYNETSTIPTDEVLHLWIVYTMGSLFYVTFEIESFGMITKNKCLISHITMIYENSKNFCICMNYHPLGNGIANFQVVFNLILYIMTCILIFLEWNIKESFHDIRALTVIMCIDGISQFLLSIIKFVPINNFVTYYVSMINIFRKIKNIKTEEEQNIIKDLLAYNNITTVKESDIKSSTYSTKGALNSYITTIPERNF
ncbi:hypothetical protein PIROE2DRAFT_11271, partial [Piromyces sp. E2]